MENKIPNFDYSNVKWQENGKLKLCIIVGTRPEIIRLAAVINKCRQYFDVILVHTGQNYDYNLNGVFFKNLKSFFLIEDLPQSLKSAITKGKYTNLTRLSPHD